MINQFRNRYPNARFISELLAIDHGKFIVRVLIQVEDVILATGLAAAETVETAEDQARKRAIDILGDSVEIPKPQPTASSSTTLQTSSSPITQIQPVANTNEFTPTLDSEVKSSTDPLTSDDWLSATYIKPETKTPAKRSSKKDTSQSGRSASLPPFPLNNPEGNSNEPTQPEETQSPTPTPITASSRTQDSQDFSSDIAKTDIQLQRLGWTAEQGAAHLLKTYGKRSRRLLTEEELLDFLNYLESLDTPISSD
ncbi:MAG: hypothetical protein WBA77_17115 [Microcoleaceae cyanobacterium]